MNLFGKKIPIIILYKTQLGYKVLKKANIPATQDFYHYKDKAYTVNPLYAAWENGPLIYDMKNTEPLFFMGNKETILAKDVETELRSDALTRLTKSGLMKIFIIAIIIVAIGGVIGTMFGQYQLAQQNAKMLQLLNQTITGLPR